MEWRDGTVTPFSKNTRINLGKNKSLLIPEQAFLELDPATTYFPTRETCSIIGSSRLNFRVRDGNGCDPADTITGKLVKSVNRYSYIVNRSL